MILIFSNQFDLSTNDVQDWLDHFGVSYYRINSEDFGKIQIDNLSNPECIQFGDISIDLRSVDAVWLRKWSKPKFTSSGNQKKEEELINRNLIEDEFVALSNYLFSLFKRKPGIMDRFFFGNQKLIQLLAAEKSGFKTPYSKLVSSKMDLPMDRRFITKPIEKAPSEIESRFFTSLMNDDLLSKIPTNFFPSLIQELIPKLFEIRVFYLDNLFSAIAIFSQEDNQTEIDFRNYNHKKPNRYVPYSLDKDTKEKIHNLMKSLDMKSGSIDLIKSTNGEIIFLEVNPNGQFGMVSKNGNENLEKLIAQHLCNHNQS